MGSERQSHLFSGFGTARVAINGGIGHMSFGCALPDKMMERHGTYGISCMYQMRDIRDLVKRREKPDPPKKVTDDEVTQQAYLEDLARMRDFSPPASKILWPSAIGPRWKN